MRSSAAPKVMFAMQAELSCRHVLVPVTLVAKDAFGPNSEDCETLDLCSTDPCGRVEEPTS